MSVNRRAGRADARVDLHLLCVASNDNGIDFAIGLSLKAVATLARPVDVVSSGRRATSKPPSLALVDESSNSTE